MDRSRRVERSQRRALLVDLDDTLFDHTQTCRGAIAAVGRSEPWLRRRPLSLLLSTYMDVLEAHQGALRAGTVSVEASRRARWQRLGRLCGEELTESRSAEIARAYRAHYEKARRPVAGAEAFLRGLHGRVPVVVVSNGPEAGQAEKLRLLRFDRLVDGLVTSGRLGFAKPDRRIFDEAVRVAGSTPAETTMLGDSWPNDVVGASGAGILPVWFNRFARAAPAGPAAPELRSFGAPRRARELLLGGPVPPRASPREL